MVAINYRLHTIHHPEITHGVDYPNMGDFLAEGRLKNLTPTEGMITELGPQDGFDRGYEVHMAPNNGIGERVKRYLFHLSEDHVYYDLLAECEENKFARKCTLQVNGCRVQDRPFRRFDGARSGVPMTIFVRRALRRR